MLIASDGLYAELHRRSGSQWITELLRGNEGVLALRSVGIEMVMSDIYEGIALSENDT